MVLVAAEQVNVIGERALLFGANPSCFVFVVRLANYEAERIIVDGKLFDGASLRVDGASPCMILVSVALHALLPHVLHLKTSRWHARIQMDDDVAVGRHARMCSHFVLGCGTRAHEDSQGKHHTSAGKHDRNISCDL